MIGDVAALLDTKSSWSLKKHNSWPHNTEHNDTMIIKLLFLVTIGLVKYIFL